jgi:glycerate kinase
MRIVLAPDSFKESLSARQACEAIARGIRSVHADAEIDAIPMADGGEGTVDALVSATGGTLRRTTVTGPLGEPVEATWGLLGGSGPLAAVIEMAAASGLALVPPDRRNPLLTTTYGTGELIRAALAHGVKRVIIGIGGSATTDGGTGAAQALGVEFLDSAGRLIPPPMTGAKLAAIAHIKCGTGVSPVECGTGVSPVNSAPGSHQPTQESGISILVACDVDNPLCGPRGAAAIYGPQKGATPEMVEQLDQDLAHLAEIIERDLGKNVRDFPGAGAAGGLGAGLVAFLDARLDRGIRLVMEAVRFNERITGADLIITGEGKLDRQSMMGKVIEGVGRAGQAAGVPVVALVGTIGEGAETTLQVLHSYHAINPENLPLHEALSRTPGALEAAAARLFREPSLPRSAKTGGVH